MFLELQADIVRNLYEGDAAPPDAPDGSIRFVPVADRATAMARIGMRESNGAFLETDESRQRTAPVTPAIAPTSADDKLDEILKHLTDLKARG